MALGVWLLAAHGAAAQPVRTAAPPMTIGPEQFMALAARLDALEQRNRELEAEVRALKGPATTAAAPKPTAVEAKLENARPSLASRNGEFTASLRGVFQLDASHYDQAAPGLLATDFRRGSFLDTTEADRARDLSDGTNFRRARLGIEGKAFGDWNYNFLYEFGGSGVEEPGRINAAWLEYAGLGRVRIRVGGIAPPVGIEDVTSTNASLFAERAAVSELTRNIAAGDARSGLGLYSNGKRWNVSAAVTGGVVGGQSFDEQLAVTGRAVVTPLVGKDYLVHLGANSQVVINPAVSGPDVASGAARPVRLRERPEARVDGTRLVDTGAIDAAGVEVYGAELAGQFKALSLQGEYYWIQVERRASALPDPSFSGWYVQGGWTITGQPRRYSIASGAFDAPRGERFSPKDGQWGVWELAVRYSDLDLDFDSLVTAAAIRGGRQKITTLGLNWYPNAAVRFQAGWQNVDVDRLSPGGAAFGAGVLTPPAGAQVGQSFDIWSLRTQYAF